MHPILFRIGDFPVGSYALMALLGLASGVAVFAWLGGRDGHERRAFVEMGLWAFIIAILSSKLFGALLNYDPNAPRESVVHVVRFGGHYWVGFLAGVTYLFIALRRRGVPLGRGLDFLVIGLSLAHVFGRIGCFLAGCCWGEACVSPWAVEHLGVTFTSAEAAEITGVPTDVALHPTQLYEAAAELVIFAVLLTTHLRWRLFDGRTFLHYVLLYGPIRFLIEFVREDPRGQPVLGLSTTQALLVPTVLAAACAYGWCWRRERARCDAGTELGTATAAPTPAEARPAPRRRRKKRR